MSLTGEWQVSFADDLEAMANEEDRKGPGHWTWPNDEYRDDPVRFCRIEMGVELVDYTIEGAEAIRDHPFVAISGGRKVSKDFLIACLAWWFYCTFPKARVRFTAVTGEQTRDVFWREVRMRWAESGRCVDCKRDDPQGPKPCPHAHPIPEVPADLPATGVRSNDFREMVGLTASSEEAAAGVSGPNQFYIVDEATDVPEFVFEAIDGNIGGCEVARVVYLSNPTRNQGRFFEAFHEKADSYRTLQWSSRNSPNVRAGKVVVPGLATQEWIDKMVEIYGEGSQWVTIHIDGKFVKNLVGTVFSLDAIKASNLRWPHASMASSILEIGIDVAGASDRADESGFAIRRGEKILEVYARHGLDPDSGAHLVEALGLMAKHRQTNDEIVVCIDREGEQGAKVWKTFREYLVAHDDAFRLIGVRASERAHRDPRSYERVRDELVANLADWMRNGGAIPTDAKVQAELNAFRWRPQPPGRLGGRSQLESKDDMRKALGRSPDRADAISLACWSHVRDPSTADEGGAPAVSAPGTTPDGRVDPHDYSDQATFDPYAFADAARGRR